jgi:DNA primase
MAKVRRPEGPPARYVVQLLLYALGYRNLGLPVERVMLAALPRTEPSLDAMYVWEHKCEAVDDVIIEAVLGKTALRRQIAGEVLARRIPITAVPITPSDDGCYFCFGGETEVVTRDGIKPIRELAGTTPELLVPNIGMSRGLAAQGNFVSAPVRAFGEQRLWKITLTSRRAEKIIYATAEHRWLLTARESRAQDPERPLRPLTDQWPERTTAQLKPGDRLKPLRAATPARAQLMPWAVAQGFVFGDGTRGQGDRPATLSIYDNGKDEALLPFFPFTEPVQYEDKKHIYGLPRFWKDLPPIRESRTFLLSWLAGYFAADGDVTKDGQVTLNSADQQAIWFARDVAAVCGIGYNPPRSIWRLGTGTELTQLWSLNLRRRDLPEWFFLIKEHAVRAAAANQDTARGTYWTVKSVETTSRTETVYCATVPGTEMFGLADDLLTSNCPFYRPQSARDGGPGCPGHSSVSIPSMRS